MSEEVAMQRNALAVVFLSCVSILPPLSAFAAHYVKPDVCKQWRETGKQMVIIDIQPADEFEKQHFKESIETNAFLAKMEEEKKLIDKALPVICSSKDDVVIICPRGRSGASNTYDYLMFSKGVPESRLPILEGGIDGWRFKEHFVAGR
jgi:rhodanese-related sulfurtransferase